MFGPRTLRARRLTPVFVISLLFPCVLWAQTVVNPRSAEFDPSPDHYVDDGGIPRVQEYRLSVYVLGQSTPVATASLGKPIPDVDGKIRFDLLSALPVALAPGITYLAKVTAIGPSGESESLPSNEFIFQSTPYQPACVPTISATDQAIAAAGGSGSVSVTADPGCTWTATSAAPWLTVTAGASGSGAGVVTCTADANTSSTSRSGTLTIAGQPFTVTQAAATSCSATVQPSGLLAIADGGTGVVSVTISAGCPWTSSTNASWLTVTAGATGTGSGTVSLFATPNTSSVSRTGTVTVAGQTVTVTQSGQSCTYSITPTGQYVSAAGGSGSFGVTTLSGCAWTASSTVAWLTVNAGGGGSGTATFTASTNMGTSTRTGNLTIAGQTVTVTQAAAPPACTYAIGATSQSLPAAGGSGLVSVTTASGCAWTAVSNAMWLTITAGATGSGSATVAFSATANTTTMPRTGTLTIAGQTFTVTQSVSACSYTISATTAVVPVAGGTGSVSVSTQSGCAWSGTSSADWVTITAGVSGTGSGIVSFVAAANTTTTPRTATLTIAGLPFTVTQPAGATVCSYVLNPATAMVDWRNTTGTVTVTTAPGCTWKATTSANWIKLGNASSTKQAYTVAPNKSSSSRTGTIEIGTSTLTVIQRGR
jgi:Putative binding domain, N-terminal